MRKVMTVLMILFVSGAAFLAACNENKSVAGKSNQPDSLVSVKRGEYLVSVLGCDDCHSPKRMGPRGPEIIPELRLSGFQKNTPLLPVDTNVIRKGWALTGPDITNTVGPWGMTFAANLTNDATGIGNWTEAQFMNAIRKGKYKGLDNSRDLLPTMPWYFYKNLTDEDLKSVFAYLKTMKPVDNVVPAHIPFDKLK